MGSPSEIASASHGIPIDAQSAIYLGEKSTTKELKFKYKNWQGKKTARRVEPIKVWYGKTKWHNKKQWFLKAGDVDKNEVRDFAVKDIIKFL